jgi:hypothetical protein
LALEDDPGLVRKRAAALEQLRATLTGPPRKPTRVARQYIERTDWEIGHAIAYRLRSGRWAIMRVIQHHTGPHGQRLAVVEVCDWTGSEIPERAELEALPTGQSATLAVQLERLRQTASREGWSNAELESEIDGFIDWDNKLCLYGRRQSDFPRDRLQVAATALNVRNTHGAGTTFFGGWPALDD